MSDTPRTDVVSDNWPTIGAYQTLARSLELDLNRVTNERDALLAERSISPWNPVSEPPKQSRNGLLAIDSDGDVYIADYYEKRDEWTNSCRYGVIEPTHWMEIPDLIT
jgi:hypothetical protein